MQGGKSNSSMKAVEGGASNSKGALQISGEVIAGGQVNYAGLSFSPGSSPMEPANLSTKKTIGFWAKGDGKTYLVALLSNGSEGMPPNKPFVAGAQWKQYSFPLADFSTDGSEITSLAFVSVAPGKFDFEIDEVEIK
jgi:hypothetical protein